MKLIHLSLENFGVFGGKFNFDLTPSSDDQFTRPIILFRGKNGVGKTTLVEAIRLCLHGSLALANRMSKVDYEEYLRERIFKNNGYSGEAANICLVFEHVVSGKSKTFEVKRTWQIINNNVQENINILEDGSPPIWLDEETKDLFLRELIPPLIINFFFLDGEKLESLTSNIANPVVISNIVTSIFGLHLSDQLTLDLDIFISRQNSLNGHIDHINQLKKFHRTIDRLNQKQIDRTVDLQRVSNGIIEYENKTQGKEQEIAQAGGIFVQDFNSLREKENILQIKIDEVKGEIQELFSGLLPFAASPIMLKKVVDRLVVEKNYRYRKAAQITIRKQKQIISNSLNNDDLWQPLGDDLTTAQKKIFTEGLNSLLKQALPPCDARKNDIIIHTSDQDSEVIISWIKDATGMVPRDFRKAIEKYENLTNELMRVRDDLVRVPPEETITPLYNELKTLRDKLLELGKSKILLEEEINRIEYEKQTLHNSIQNTRDSIQASENLDERIQLASRTQALLEEYSNIMLEKKISLFEKAFVGRFNSLCRKSSYIDEIHVNPETFVITLQRGEYHFLHKELSAGETQLFTVAFVWALHDIAGLPIPMVFDTPLARLDTDHRQRMLSEFLPKASHQMLLLATDAEIDQAMIDDLAPALSHGYHLKFDDSTKSTIVEKINIG